MSAFPLGLWGRTGESLPHTIRPMASGDRIASAGDPIGEIAFPLTAVLVQARNDDYDTMPLVSGMVGPEGMVGWCALLGAVQWPHEVFAVIAGDVAVVAVDDLLTATEHDRELRDLLFRYLHNFTMQLTQNTIANLGHSVERRLARWLTMFHDRVAGDELRLTHETLAMLLNVRRASVTDSLHILEGEHLVRCTRGKVTVRDRPGLQARAGHSYGYAEGDYNAAIGPFGKASAAQQL